MSYLNQILFYFDAQRKDSWTISDAVKGTQIFGGIGSGKTSGSGKLIAKSFLRNGFGGVVLCGKPDEASDWLKYAQEVGRIDDVLLFKKGSDFRFNPLQYELERKGEGAGETMNIVNLFMSIYRMGQRLTGGESQESERYWENALKRCLARTIDLLKLSQEELSVFNMAKILSSAPSLEEDDSLMARIGQMNEEELEKLRDENYCIDCLFTAYDLLGEEESSWEFDLVYNYFLREFAKMHEKARTTVQEMFLGLTDAFNSGILKEHFSEGLNIYPEDSFQGKIIILDFPVKNYLDAGIYAQSIFKLLWQQATERREVKPDTKAVFLWVDESQYFVNEYDMLFQTTARSSRACTVFLSQNISNYYAAMGGKSAEARVNSLLGNLSTKIFHGNNDYVTNEWAANTIGKKFMNVSSITVGGHQSSGLNQQLHYQVEPVEFTTLKSGGNENDLIVEGVITITGKKWSDGKNYRTCSFSQKI